MSVRCENSPCSDRINDRCGDTDRMVGNKLLGMMRTAVVGLSLMVLLAACVSDRYRAAPGDAPKPVPINLVVSHPPFQVVLNTVIVFEGPGSWKREAYWDEYVCSISNQSADPFTLESATLVGCEAIPVGLGVDPWLLEEHSLSWWSRVSSSENTPYVLTVGYAAVVGVAAAYVSATTALASGATAASVALSPAVLVLPAYLAVVDGMNFRNKTKITEEFQRRRVNLPVTIEPRTTRQGSLFFPITPGPARLTLHGRIAGQLRDITIALQPLSGLHMKFAAGKSPPVSP